MKKLLLLLLLSVVCFLFAEELDRDIYMPEKLVHAELPEDISEDIEYLFRRDYEFYKELYEKFQDTNKRPHNVFVETLLAIPEEEANRIAYLAWYAWHTMPQYFAEYALINSRYIRSFLGQDEELDRKLHEASYALQLFGDKINDVTNLYSAISIPCEGIEKSAVLRIWIRAKVISSEVITVHRFDRIYRDDNKKETSMVNIEVIDDISGIFPYDELTIEGFYSGPKSRHKYQNLLEEGKEYLIPLTWHPRQHSRTSNDNEQYYPLVYPSARLHFCLLIEDEQIDTSYIPDNVRGSRIKHMTRRLFGEEISYEQAREIIRSNIDKLRECGGVR